MLKVANDVGQKTIFALERLGKVFVFFGSVFNYLFQPKFYLKEFLKQCFRIGFLSLPVVALTAVFTGAVIALQTYIGASRWNVIDTVPSLVVLTITRELAPVLTALMVAGKVTSSIAAELGTMKVTEQIDALKTLSTNPIKYLIIPRILATVISLPLLVLVADVIGVFGGYLVSVYNLKFNSLVYLIKTINFLQFDDVFSGVVKSIFFGFIISFSGCYCGYNSKNGAEGVGKATTNSVVIASILIFLFNFVMTKMFFN
jgi:phospholipid/cholesterol/gamma-HCH transport system permease protein